MWVYLVGNIELKWFKIGITKDIVRRISQIQNNLPFKIERLGSWEVKYGFAEAVEEQTHARFYSKHIQHEWFRDLDIAEVAEFVSEEIKKYAKIVARF